MNITNVMSGRKATTDRAARGRSQASRPIRRQSVQAPSRSSKPQGFFATQAAPTSSGFFAKTNFVAERRPAAQSGVKKSYPGFFSAQASTPPPARSSSRAGASQSPVRRSARASSPRSSGGRAASPGFFAKTNFVAEQRPATPSGVKKSYPGFFSSTSKSPAPSRSQNRSPARKARTPARRGGSARSQSPGFFAKTNFVAEQRPATPSGVKKSYPGFFNSSPSPSASQGRSRSASPPARRSNNSRQSSSRSGNGRAASPGFFAKTNFVAEQRPATPSGVKKNYPGFFSSQNDASPAPSRSSPAPARRSNQRPSSRSPARRGGSSRSASPGFFAKTNFVAEKRPATPSGVKKSYPGFFSSQSSSSPSTSPSHRASSSPPVMHRSNSRNSRSNSRSNNSRSGNGRATSPGFFAKTNFVAERRPATPSGVKKNYPGFFSGQKDSSPAPSRSSPPPSRSSPTPARRSNQRPSSRSPARRGGSSRSASPGFFAKTNFVAEKRPATPSGNKKSYPGFFSSNSSGGSSKSNGRKQNKGFF